MVKPISIREALKLYQLLSPYLPDIGEVDTGLDFIGKIVHNIVEKNQHHIYIESVALMLQTTVEDVVENLNSEEVLMSFSDGIEENHILELQNFGNKIGLYG